MINREPYSFHIDLINKIGFNIVYEKKIKDISEIKRKHLASRFRGISEDDLTTSAAFIQAVKTR